MGTGFKLLGKDFAEKLIATTNNPLVGLFIGILVTSLVQSSGCTTSITVGLVAVGGLTLHNAIPIIMGANIGTTVTNILVSLGHITRKDEFKRAFAGSTVHDMFNILSVLTIFPLQVKFSILEKTAQWLTNMFLDIGGINLMDPVKYAVEPCLKLFCCACKSHPIPIIIIGLVFLFTALSFIIKAMRGAVATRAEKYLKEFIFQYPMRAFIAGMLLTGNIHSSSVTTSIVIPLVGAGILTVEAIYPYVLGVNIGTTATALLAAFATANPVALTVALTHSLFNLLGTCIYYPLKILPISMAKGLGVLAVKNRLSAIIYIAAAFYGIPLLLIWLSR